MRVAGRRRGDRRLGVGVVAGAGLGERRAAAEREVDDEVRHAPLDHLVDRVDLDHHHPAAGAQRQRHLAQPEVDVVDPADGADRDVDEVEAPVQRLGQRARVGLDGLDLHPDGVGELADPAQRGGGEVGARDARPGAGHDDAVGAEVALQVEHVAVAYAGQRVVVRRAGGVGDRALLHAGHERPARDDPVEAVVRVGLLRAVSGGGLLPVVQVAGELVRGGVLVVGHEGAVCPVPSSTVVPVSGSASVVLAEPAQGLGHRHRQEERHRDHGGADEERRLVGPGRVDDAARDHRSGHGTDVAHHLERRHDRSATTTSGDVSDHGRRRRPEEGRRRPRARPSPRGTAGSRP